MEIPPAESVFDVAEWFLDAALNDGEYLQPMKMQYLMFLSQGYYAALTQGKRFVPGIFLAAERGPVEPNSYRLFVRIGTSGFVLSVHEPQNRFLFTDDLGAFRGVFDRLHLPVDFDARPLCRSFCGG